MRRLGSVLAALASLALAGPAPKAGEPSPPPTASAPSLRLPDLEGAEHSLDEWRDRVRVVNFWASDCAPCQVEIRKLVRWQDQYRPTGLQVVGVGIDDERRLRNVRRSLSINYPVLVVAPERSAVLLSDWGNARRVVPYNVVLDRSGGIAYRQYGALDQETFDEAVLPLLQRAPSSLPGSP